MDRKEKNVVDIYDQLAPWFALHRDVGLMEKPYLDALLALLPGEAQLLDVGCGTGLPIMGYFLRKGLQVTGVDGSARLLEIAKNNFPYAAFALSDMRELSLGQRFDAIIAWHSFFHLPAVDQPAMFRTFKKHLRPEGCLLFTSGTEHGEAWGNMNGEPLYHASLSTKEYRQLLDENEFEVISHTENDPDCGGATVWMVQLRDQAVRQQDA